MSLTLQILLIVATILLFIILVKNVKKGKLRTDYALAWILCANMVFAAIIFMLIILVYVLFSKVSTLEEKQKNLIQEIAILKKKNDLK